MGGSLAALHQVLNHSLSGLFTGVHVLPPFLSSGDRGFAPIDYAVIEPSFGTWDDMAALARDYDVMLDIMVNHVSRLSPFFRDYLEKGDDSAYARGREGCAAAPPVSLLHVYPQGWTEGHTVDDLWCDGSV